MNAIEQWVLGASMFMLTVAALLVVVRITRGPSVLDRVIASDVMVSLVVCVLGIEAAVTRHTTTLPILISLSLVGFVGAVSVARFVARDRDTGVDPGVDRAEHRDEVMDFGLLSDPEPDRAVEPEGVDQPGNGNGNGNGGRT